MFYRAENRLNNPKKVHFSIFAVDLQKLKLIGIHK